MDLAIKANEELKRRSDVLLTNPEQEQFYLSQLMKFKRMNDGSRKMVASKEEKDEYIVK